MFADSELEAISVIQNFRITAADGKTHNTQHYKLAAIIAVGYKVNSERAVQFRKWATDIIESFTIRGYLLPHYPKWKTLQGGSMSQRSATQLVRSSAAE